jgi:pimeloyl-ACP methyl ester carboxylesterase
LTRRGIAVLRYDDRGFGKSTGNHFLATTYDFAIDAREVVAFVKTHPKINPEKVHLLGHSEGGLIATIVASKTKTLKSIILLASPGERSDRVMVLQQQKILKANGATEKEIERNTTLNEDLFLLIGHSDTIEDAKKVVRPYLQKYAKNLTKKELSVYGSKSAFVDKMELAYLNPWMYSFLKIEPHKYLKNVTCNVLAMNGTLDLQVDAKQNLSAIAGKLSNDVPRKDMYELNGLNHLFQQARTGNVTEYGEIEQTFSEEALLIISNWILSF